RHHEGWNDQPGHGVAEKMIVESALQGLFQLFVNQLGAVEGSQEPAGPTDPSIRQRRKYLPAVIAVETGNFGGRYAQSQAKGDDAPGRCAGDHVEILRQRRAAAEILFTMLQDFGGVDAPDPAAVERKNFE